MTSIYAGAETQTGKAAPGLPKQTIYRHKATVRVTHWINALCVFILLMSGLNILQAHPALYWGSQSDFAHPWIRFDSRFLQALPRIPDARDLATGRNYHFFFAWIFVINLTAYLAYGFWSRHIQTDLTPTKAELANFGEVVKEHARFHFPHVRRYNVIQGLTYLIVVLVLLPLMVLTGLTMSPGFDSITHGLLHLFGGRQSARTVHFLSASGISIFIFIHIALVLIAGVKNNIVSMVTGNYEIEPDTPSPTETT